MLITMTASLRNTLDILKLDILALAQHPFAFNLNRCYSSSQTIILSRFGDGRSASLSLASLPPLY
jgi:hypothetical protein